MGQVRLKLDTAPTPLVSQTFPAKVEISANFALRSTTEVRSGVARHPQDPPPTIRSPHDRSTRFIAFASSLRHVVLFREMVADSHGFAAAVIDAQARLMRPV